MKIIVMLDVRDEILLFFRVCAQLNFRLNLSLLDLSKQEKKTEKSKHNKIKKSPALLNRAGQITEHFVSVIAALL